ncbi:MAG: peptidoglycan editing factor PgeF [Chlorobium sp.]|uniref:peptidoglycan editing factor PgeF n=1 Tax=Chlorobium sp. TaxID=1095 RepID=UPI0025B8176C|nr:peptidoglycan editing factor PgeF [Chlorobium sp.]MCF8217109.1 peptidoglycan editing factor PgeF [Chlorobium sp.]MCF8271955.1 peptidoglycan editing factor PgeF [Chlorobium sp.]MCF8288326.1 peptidoglycan editing factor PgeF [Chlorobium sp.]MCF8291929.1 peptidoglycan editing factor PgeF [Chlorobium sp.]MCF8386036.1 peptidoglycan editing factor PgeF [Chlorobium sp.]
MKKEPFISRKEYIVPDLFRKIQNLVALQTTRCGGVSPHPYDSLNFGLNTGDSRENIEQNTLRLCHLLGITDNRLACSDQVHGTSIFHAIAPGFYPGYDAFVTAEKELFLCIFTADCFPVLLCDTETMSVAAIHAGWKGTAGHIVTKTIDVMRERFGSDPKNLLAWIGTGISQSAYEVDAGVAEAFEKEHLAPSREYGKFNLDLAGANRSQLIKAGVPESQVECSALCTSDDAALYYSYRRDAGRTGRMLSMIGVTTVRKMRNRAQ